VRCGPQRGEADVTVRVCGVFVPEMFEFREVRWVAEVVGESDNTL
jgi:hypothetical protein